MRRLCAVLAFLAFIAVASPASAQSCIGQPNGTPCATGNLCELNGTCFAEVCQGSNPVVCSLPDQCHFAGICNPGTGLCVYSPKPDTTPCDDGNACTSPDTCQGGVCTGGPAVCGLAVVSGTKTVSGSFAELGAIAYTVTLTNSGAGVQGDNPGNEFSDTLPSSLTLVSANASSGTAGAAGNAVSWNGSIAATGSVTITINATINAGTAGQFISNQGSISFDGDGSGSNETTVVTDDPSVGGASDPTVFQATAAGALAFHTVAQCRVLDTRNATGPLGGPALVAGADRNFTIAGNCGIPVTAKAISVNVAVTGSTAAGNLRLHPGGTQVPLVSAINYAAGQTRANNAVLVLNASGELAGFCGQATGTVHFILDVNGYFE